MKRIGVLLTLALLTVFFFSCEKDEVDYGLDEYKVDMVTVQLSNEDPYFLLDNGKTIFCEKVNLSGLKDQQRIILNYSILSDSKSGFDYTARANYISSVAQGELQLVSPFQILTLRNDPIQLESAWVGSHYLNIQLRFDYKSQPHKIILIADSFQKNENLIRIAFRHDINNDSPGSSQKVVASYDLKPVLGNALKGKKLLVNFNTTNYGDTTIQLNY